MPRRTALVLFLALLAACGGDDDENGATPPSTAATSGAAQAEGTTRDAAKPAEAPPPDNASSSEAVPFQTTDGAVIEAQLFSVPGPNQRIVVIAGTDALSHAEVYAGLVEPGLAVLAFNTPEDDSAAGAIETAVRLARSRAYPLIFVVALGPAGEAATAASESVEVDGVLAVETDAGPEALVDSIRELVGR